MNYALDIDRAITLALNGSESLFWDNLMVCVTNTFSWSLVIVMLLYIFFHNFKAIINNICIRKFTQTLSCTIISSYY